MATIYLALGSNLGQSKDNIQTAIAKLQDKVSDIKTAPYYLSKAVGYKNQPDFTNTAIQGTTYLNPQDLLKFLKLIEKKIGRVERFRWGPREIDIDIILYDSIILNSNSLTLPHPHFRVRDFVLQPIFDLNPHAFDPVSKLTVSELLDQLSPEQKSQLQRLT